MKTNSFDRSVNLRDSREIPDMGPWAVDEDWGSWIDPNDPRDSLRLGTVESVRSATRLRAKGRPTTGEQPKTPAAELRPSGGDSPAASAG